MPYQIVEEQSTPARHHAAPAKAPRTFSLLLLLALFAAIYGATLGTPSLLDDADATHASAALHMAKSGDLVTLKVDGIRYLEKPPLPYWLVALDFRAFCLHGGEFNANRAAFATHLPDALAVLLLAGLGYWWALLAWGERAAFYSGLSLLTAAGVFLFTRVFIPEALLSLFLCAALFCLLRGLELRRPTYFYATAALVAFAVLTKGLIAPVFFIATVFVFLFLTGELGRWRELHLFRCTMIFLAIAAPWHILAGLRNGGGLNGRGFFWFYFINEHVLRFLGRRYPVDYNKLPSYLYWSLHLVWLFPWSLFFPLALLAAWRKWRGYPLPSLARGRRFYGVFGHAGFAGRTVLLLSLYSALVLCFFSLSTNQEYYTFPAYLPLAILLSAALAGYEYRSEAGNAPSGERGWITAAHAALTLIMAGAAAALCYGLWSSRHLPFVPDIGDLLAHRGVGNYTLSMSHFFDLTGPSFAALRLPAALAAAAFAFGPGIAWRLRALGRNRAATTAIALTSAVFLLAAHIALVRFEPMLSSRDFADKIQEVMDDHPGNDNSELYLYGDQAYGSSVVFYTGRIAYLVNGRTSSMIWGSTYADAPRIFLDGNDLLARWGSGPRKFLFVPMEERDAVDALFANHPDVHPVLLDETSGKALITDRPLPPPGVGE
ncbi:MAG TPA: glycosyltransferase family 39 protein [Acidobacteriaceae bacterium]